jgi:hypothetical protein
MTRLTVIPIKMMIMHLSTLDQANQLVNPHVPLLLGLSAPNQANRLVNLHALLLLLPSVSQTPMNLRWVMMMWFQM